MTPSRISLRANALRLSILGSLGVLTVACGGSAEMNGSGGSTSGGGGSGGGTSPNVSGGSAGRGDVTAGSAGIPGGGKSSIGPFDCTNPEDYPEGFSACPDGIAHRTHVVTCQVATPVPIGIGVAGAGGEAGSGNSAQVGDVCLNDSDCNGIPLGYCAGVPGTVTCHAGCQVDSDCGPGAACLCNDSKHGGSCLPATCSSDAACAPGSYCIREYNPSSPCADDPGYLACDDGRDLCQSDADCTFEQACRSNGSRRSCVFIAVCGRPFLVENTARVAEITTERGWQSGSHGAPALGDLSANERAQLAAHWARLGQMEHASIAAFARFNLQLLSFGAPASLVEACNRAIVDETAHAKLCFGLASEYAGSPVGPGVLDLNHCLDGASLLAVMKLVLREGCLGETTAALEAAEAAELAIDPAVKAALCQIARDEQRHAELAFEFMRWALTRATPAERSEIQREAAVHTDALLGSTPRSPSAPQASALAAHGVVPEQTLAEVRRQAARGAIQPLLAVLFGAPRDALGGFLPAPQLAGL